MFQWGRRVVFQLGGASVLSEGCTPLGDIGFDGGFLKNRRMWGRPLLPPSRIHYGKPRMVNHASGEVEE